MSIERIKDDTHIRTRLIDLRIRSGEIMVTRCFSQAVHLPLVLFFIRDNETIPCSPQKIKAVGDCIAFDTDSDLHGNIKTNGRDALLISLECFGAKVGFMCPSVNAECFFGDQIEPIDKRFTTIAMYKNESDDPTHQHLAIPMIRLVDGSCLSVSTQMDSGVQFSHFIHHYAPYFNVTHEENLQVALRGFGNMRAAMSHFYEQNGYTPPLPISGRLDLLRMKQALYLNAPLQDVSIDLYIEQTALWAQRLLDQHRVKNCVIGSLALSTHLPNIAVKDIDIAVNNLAVAKKAFKDNEITVPEQGKWKDCAFRVQYKNSQLDIVELKRFDWDAVVEKRRLRVLNHQGLLMMKLMGEFERSLMQPNYEVFQIKNQHSILSLFPEASFVYPFFADFLRLDTEENFRRLKGLLENAEWDSTSMSVTYPLYANAFKHEQETFIPIVNNGSPCQGKIWISKKIKSASWVALDGHNEDCVVSNSNDIAEMLLPIIEDTGILVCQNA